MDRNTKLVKGRLSNEANRLLYTDSDEPGRSNGCGANCAGLAVNVRTIVRKRGIALPSTSERKRRLRTHNALEALRVAGAFLQHVGRRVGVHAN